jgi:hypothetical protein
MSAKLVQIVAMLSFVASLLVGIVIKAGAAEVIVRPPLTTVAPGAVVIKPLEPCAQPPFTVRPPFAVKPFFDPFFLELPAEILNPCPPTFFDPDLLFDDPDFLLGVGARQ